MSYLSLEAAAHIPPHKWDFNAMGAWKCSHCGETAELETLSARAADEDDDAQKKLTKLLKADAAMHMEAMFLEALIVRIGTASTIVDQMYCVVLNIGSLYGCSQAGAIGQSTAT
eukprot:381055-Pleurochrysis_carterae.AAC.1